MACNMGVVDRKLAVLGRIARLRLVQARLPNDADIAAVRAELEAELGETVSQRLAARFLGVSHTALGRWIQSGDVPLVFSRQGRMEVPVPALLDLSDAIAAGDGSSAHPLERALTDRRDRAARISAAADQPRGLGGHEEAERRGLAYHRAVADQLTQSQVDEALYRVRKWRHEGKMDPAYSDRWEKILDAPIPRIRRVLTDEAQASVDLRQNSPFAGTLSEPERRAILLAASR